MSDPQQPTPPQAQPYPPAYPPAPQQYAQPTHPYPPMFPAPGQQPYAPAVAPTGAPAVNRVGRIAFLVAALAVALSLLLTITGPFVYRGVDYSLIDALMGMGNVVITLAAGAGLVLGVLALRRPGSTLLAAIAIGLAGSTFIGRIVGWASTLLYYF